MQFPFLLTLACVSGLALGFAQDPAPPNESSGAPASEPADGAAGETAEEAVVPPAGTEEAADEQAPQTPDELVEPAQVDAQDAPEGARPPAELTRVELEAEVVELRAALAAEEARTAALEGELTSLQARRLVEQQTFYDWLEFVATVRPELMPKDLPSGFALATGGVDPTAEAEPEPEPEPDPGLVRAEEMLISLRNLLRTEGVFAYDLLTTGRYDDGVVGPVVFRLLDDRGRLAGSLNAQRLRLEAGRAGQTVTVVLEAGSAHRGGQERAFEVERIPLPHVDPAPWIEMLPELFREEDLGKPVGDGDWDLPVVRAALNDLLAADITGGYLQLKAFEGVADGFLLGAHFTQYDASGRVQRQLFADSVRLRFLDRGALVELFGAVSMRGAVKTPFPGGTHRVFLPNASQPAWRRAGLPGIPGEASAGNGTSGG